LTAQQRDCQIECLFCGGNSDATQDIYEHITGNSSSSTAATVAPDDAVLSESDDESDEVVLSESDVEKVAPDDAVLSESDVEKVLEDELLLDSDDEHERPLVVPSQASSGPAKRQYRKRQGCKKNSHLFAGSVVCMFALQALLGIGSGYIQMIRHGQNRLTRKEVRHPTLGYSLILKQWYKWPAVLGYLWYLYHSVAEGMPHVWMQSAVERSDKTRAVCIDPPALDPESDDYDRACKTIALHLDCYGRNPEKIFEGPGTLNGPPRFLQHRGPWDCYVEFCAIRAHRQQETCGFSTFLRVFHKVFGTHLRFRWGGGSQHAECNWCNGFKRDIKNAKTAGERNSILEKYSEHIFSQWLDRQRWWNTCELSRLWFEQSRRVGASMASSSISTSVMALIADGLDQAKFRLPRVSPTGRIPKAMEKLYRPALHVVGVWIQGSVLQFAISDDNLKKDSSTQIECICRAIEESYLKSNRCLPLGLHVQQDNCCREGKNQHMLRFGIMLVVLGVYRWVSFCYLRTGHSHENIDQVFAQVVKAIAGAIFDDPDDVVELLGRLCRASGGRPRNTTGAKRQKTSNEEPRPPSNLAASAYKLDEVALWKDWGNPVGVKFTGHAQLASPHYFRLCRRVDIGMHISEAGHAGSSENNVSIIDFEPGVPRSADDICLVIKKFMADTCPAQILAVLPACRKAGILAKPLQPTGVETRRALPKKQQRSLKLESNRLRHMLFISENARTYLHQLADGTLIKLARPATYEFLKHRWNAESDRPRPDLVNTYGEEQHLRGVNVIINDIDDEQPRPYVDNDGAEDEAIPLPG